jgi:hypothetical protein
MPDRPPLDRVGQHLERLAATGQQLARLPDAAELRRRGRRRLRTRTAGAVLGMVLLAVLVFQGRELLDRDQPALPPINPVPSTATVPAPTTTGPALATTAPPSTITTTMRPSTTATSASSGGVRLTVTPSTVTPGQTVTFTGSGCPPSARVFIDLQGPLWATTARADGSYQTSFQIDPTNQPGPINIHATCGGQRSPTTTLTVRQA